MFTTLCVVFSSILQPVTVVFQSRLSMGRWSEKTLATETQWFTSAILDSGSLAPRYGSASRTTTGLDSSQFVSVSNLTPEHHCSDGKELEKVVLFIPGFLFNTFLNKPKIDRFVFIRKYVLVMIGCHYENKSINTNVSSLRLRFESLFKSLLQFPKLSAPLFQEVPKSIVDTFPHNVILNLLFTYWCTEICSVPFLNQ